MGKIIQAILEGEEEDYYRLVEIMTFLLGEPRKVRYDYGRCIGNEWIWDDSELLVGICPESIDIVLEIKK